MDIDTQGQHVTAETKDGDNADEEESGLPDSRRKVADESAGGRLWLAVQKHEHGMLPKRGRLAKKTVAIAPVSGPAMEVVRLER
ncbi:hypothetical protein [Oxalicibacterium solurbis]|uniref:Uncharacterized protein n=1 Tax=Oxalicibacterium solurbis TaxID=69280 RepID=A0A8J3B316_9BURK|nr:hypothetical protein [Oxalicibacterium solurbis]GGI54030.1 hypothetical protein GCM10011430_12040 [Oxalicibacterium solurbis]